MPSSVVILDSQHRMIFATHYPPPLRPQDVLGKTPWDAGTLAKEHAGEWRAALEHAVSSGEPRTVNAVTRAVGTWQTTIYPTPAGVPFGCVILSEQIPEEFAELTSRERRIVRMLARGRNYAQVAEELSITIGTLRNIRGRMARKLGVEPKELAAFVRENEGLFGR